MQINIRTILLLLVVMVVSCSKTEDSLQTDRVTVTIGSMPNIDIETKSILDPDGVTVKWAKGDQIAVWARNSDGAYQFSAQPFILWQFGQTYDDAKFTATIEPMPTANYDYFAVTPIPTTTDGTQASYSIPANQTGVYNSDYDIRVATPAIGKGPLTEGDNSTAVNFAFSHKVHLLRIRIPKNQLGEAITELELTFPTAVVGTLTIDATDPNAVPMLTNGSNILTIKSAKPLDEGSVITATIAPIEIADTEQIEIRAYGETSGSKPAYMPGKNFAAGRTTPIALTIPVLERKFASVELSLTDTGKATLGEAIRLFKISGPYDCNLGNGSSERLFQVKMEGEKYIFSLGRRFDPAKDNISGKTFKGTYESENAVVTNSFTMPQLKDNQRTTIDPLTVPYLFEEDFSETPGFSYDDNKATGSTNAGSNSAKDLASEYGMPQGWTGARCGAEAGKAVRICSRAEWAATVTGSYHGRIDSPALSNIREGKSPKITISFNYAMNRSCNFGEFMQPYLAVGVTTNGARDAIGSAGSSAEKIRHAIPDAVAYDLNSSGTLNGSYSNINLSANITAPSCTRNHRLIWEVYMKGYEPGTVFKWHYSNNYVYLDNIKVSIAQ